MARIIDRICDAEFEALYDVFGVTPNIENESEGRSSDWYYFYHEYTFTYNDVYFRCKLFRVRRIDVESRTYLLSGMIEGGGYGANIDEFELRDPDDVRTIANNLRNALNKLEDMGMWKMKKLYEESDDDVLDDAVDSAYIEAERNPTRAIGILLDCYKRYEQKDPLADRVANDSEALKWLSDYWSYVCWNEHGNQASIEEVGGFVGFAHTFDDADYYLDYLMYDDYDKIDNDTKDLIDRLRTIAQRYGGVGKMKKSTSSIHDMIAQMRQNNNSLTKRSVDLNGISKGFDGDIRDYVQAGDIYFSTFGYDMTIVEFYEVISVVGKQTAVLRKLRTKVENDHGYGGTATPVLGSYDGDEFRARAVNSYYNDAPVAFNVDYGGRARKWDGQPRYYNTWD